MKVFTALTMILALPLFVSAGEPQPQPVEKIFTGSGTWKSSDGKMGTVTETVNLKKGETSAVMSNTIQVKGDGPDKNMSCSSTLTFDGNGFFKIVDQDGVEGQGYCFKHEKSRDDKGMVKTCHYSFMSDKKNVEETIMYKDEVLYLMGSMMENGVTTAWELKLQKK